MKKFRLYFFFFAVLFLLIGSNNVGKAAESCIFSKNLFIGSVGEDVKCLQRYLNGGGYKIAESGVGSSGNETTYFGFLTKIAVAKWQAANNISPAVGYWGQISRSKYGALLTVVEEVEKAVAPVISEKSSVPVFEPILVCKARKVPVDYQTIQSAIDAACEGDEILIAAGSYGENILVKTNNLIIKGENTETTIIDPDRGEGIVLKDGVNSVILDSLTIVGDFQSAGINLAVLLGKANITISNLIIKNVSIGILISVKEGSVLIKNNLIIDNKFFGISDNVLSAGIITVINNTVVKNDTGYYLIAKDGKHKLSNNIIASNRTNGIAVSLTSVLREGDILTGSYNNVWNNRVNNYYSYKKGEQFTLSGIYNFSTDPSFEGVGYKLRSDSVMIDNGDPASSLDTDGTRADIGAYPFIHESKSNSATAPRSFLGSFWLLISNLFGL